MLKIATVGANNMTDFDRLVNQFNETNDVRYTQTHIQQDFYRAVIFYQPKVKSHPVTGTNTQKNVHDIAFKVTQEKAGDRMLVH